MLGTEITETTLETTLGSTLLADGIMSLSLNGEGTQENPYLITTVEEFRAMNDSTAYFKLANDLDVNDSEWASGWTSVTLRFKEFDGDGHEIRNINDLSTSVSITIGGSDTRYFKNTKLVNVVKSSNIFLANSVAGSLYFEQISLSIVGGSGTVAFQNSTDSSSAYIYLNNSNFSIAGGFKNISDSGSYGRVHINNCMVYFDDATFLNSVFRSSNAAYGTFSRVAMIGKVNFPNAITAGRIINGVNGPQYCYIALDLSNSAYKPTTFSHNRPSQACFYDKDLMGYELGTATNLYALTTEQCKDKDYLNSIGFVVV